MDHFTAVAGLAALILASNADQPVRQPSTPEPSSWYGDLVRVLSGDVREIKLGDKLYANMDERTRLVVPGRCQKEGEADLHLLASTSAVEESYVLISDLCLWIEVGRNRTRESARLDSSVIQAVLGEYHNLAIYHVHVGHLPDLENYLPAYQDLITLVLTNAGLVWTPQTDMKHRIVTTLGMVEYEFSDRDDVKRRMNYLRNLGLKGFEAQNLAYEYARPQHQRAYYSAVRKCIELEGTIRDKLIQCSPIKTEAFTIRFRPRTGGLDEPYSSDDRH
jgi:hypothetical protein